MNIKETFVWKTLRKIKNSYLRKVNYSRAKKMPECEYESYLVDKYAQMMNKGDYSAGSTLHFDNPETFTEKCQWIKLYDQDARKPIYSDKYAVRKHIKEVIGGKYLVPLISIDGKDHFSNAREIDFDKLPNQFVLKCNHGSHMNIVVTNKSELSKTQIRKYKRKLNKWLKTDYMYVVALETQYKGIKPSIIIEKYLEGGAVRDFKFTYLNSKLAFFWVNESVLDASKTTTSTYLPNGAKAPFNFNLGRQPDAANSKFPSQFETMRKLSDQLAETDNFTMIRIDWMIIGDEFYFSELTFNSAAGYDAPCPIKYNKDVGDLLHIDKSKRDCNYTYRTK